MGKVYLEYSEARAPCSATSASTLPSNILLSFVLCSWHRIFSSQQSVVCKKIIPSNLIPSVCRQISELRLKQTQSSQSHSTQEEDRAISHSAVSAEAAVARVVATAVTKAVCFDEADRRSVTATGNCIEVHWSEPDVNVLPACWQQRIPKDSFLAAIPLKSVIACGEHPAATSLTQVLMRILAGAESGTASLSAFTFLVPVAGGLKTAGDCKSSLEEAP